MEGNSSALPHLFYAITELEKRIREKQVEITTSTTNTANEVERSKPELYCHVIMPTKGKKKTNPTGQNLLKLCAVCLHARRYLWHLFFFFFSEGDFFGVHFALIHFQHLQLNSVHLLVLSSFSEILFSFTRLSLLREEVLRDPSTRVCTLF